MKGEGRAVHSAARSLKDQQQQRLVRAVRRVNVRILRKRPHHRESVLLIRPPPPDLIKIVRAGPFRRANSPCTLIFPICPSPLSLFPSRPFFFPLLFGANPINFKSSRPEIGGSLLLKTFIFIKTHKSSNDFAPRCNCNFITGVSINTPTIKSTGRLGGGSILDRAKVNVIGSRDFAAHLA